MNHIIMNQAKVTLAAIASFMTAAALLAFPACSSDSGAEDIDELLSEATTTVVFDIGRSGEFYFYDYAGSQLVGSQIITHYNFGSSSPSTTSLELRQGKHHFVWLEYDIEDNDVMYFDPDTRIFKGPRPTFIKCAEYDYEVKPTQQPAHTPEFRTLNATIKVEITDYSPDAEAPLTGYRVGESNTIRIGKMRGYPLVTSFALHGSECTFEPTGEGVISATSTLVKRTYGINTFYESQTSVSVFYRTAILCPEDGIDDICLTAEVTASDGTAIPTVALPRCSVRRGCVTTLRGPLFSGSTSDWKVTVE